MNSVDEHWTVDRKIPITIILSLLAAIMGGGIAYQDIKAGIDANKRDLEANRLKIEWLATRNDQLPERLARIESALTFIQNSVSDLSEDHRTWRWRLESESLPPLLGKEHNHKNP